MTTHLNTTESPTLITKTPLSQKTDKAHTPITKIQRSQFINSSTISSLILPISLVTGAIIGAKIGLNLCTVWAPISSFGSSYFCLFYVMPHCAVIGASLVFATYAFAIEPMTGGISQKPTSHSSNSATPSSPLTKNNPKTYLQNVPGDGDCLLYSALKHIRRDRNYFNERSTRNLRWAIAQAAQTETNPEKQKAIIYDLYHARRAAEEERRTHSLPFSHLFTDSMDMVFGDSVERIAWHQILGQTYYDYIMGPCYKAYLDQYAIRFLNEHCFNNRLIIVQSDGQGGYINRDGVGFNLLALSHEQRSSLPVLFYENNHYQYIDSANPDFWKSYRTQTSTT